MAIVNLFNSYIDNIGFFAGNLSAFENTTLILLTIFNPLKTYGFCSILEAYVKSSEIGDGSNFF